MVWATFWFLILYGPLPLGIGFCLIVGFSSFSLPFCSFLQFCFHFLPFHSAIPIVMLFDRSLPSFFGSMTQYGHLGFVLHCLWAILSHLFPPGHPRHICFSWASLALFLTLRSMHFYQLLWASLTQLSYPLSLGLMGFPSAPYFFCLHYFRLTVNHSYFSTSHTAHGFATSLSPGSFRPICFLKIHLFISWACDPLFLPLGLDGFSIHLLTLFCPCC